jgi:CubicO group peptidase (beta-lactamase class C family)
MKNILLVALMAFSTLSFGQVQQKSIDSLFYGSNGLHATNPETGVVIGIYANGKTQYYSIGTRSLNGKAALDSATLFEIGSATKTFTGLLLAKNIQEGRIGLNDHIDRYLPPGALSGKRYQNQVKLTDLASHQSGLPNLSSDKYFISLMGLNPGNPFRPVSKQYLYKILKETDTLNQYARYQYNNYAYSLLGDLIERRNKQPYASMVISEILRPLNMQNTSFAVVQSSNVAGLYDQRGKAQENMILNAVAPAGGLKSNAVDLLKYLKAQIAPTPDLKKAVDLTQIAYYTDNERAVGLGWDLNLKAGYCQKDGDTFGNSCLLRFNRQKQIAIVVLSNHQNGKLVRDAVDFLYDEISKSNTGRH